MTLATFLRLLTFESFLRIGNKSCFFLSSASTSACNECLNDSFNTVPNYPWLPRAPQYSTFPYLQSQTITLLPLWIAVGEKWICNQVLGFEMQLTIYWVTEKVTNLSYSLSWNRDIRYHMRWFQALNQHFINYKLTTYKFYFLSIYSKILHCIVQYS